MSGYKRKSWSVARMIPKNEVSIPITFPILRSRWSLPAGEDTYWISCSRSARWSKGRGTKIKEIRFEKLSLAGKVLYGFRNSDEGVRNVLRSRLQ